MVQPQLPHRTVLKDRHVLVAILVLISILSPLVHSNRAVYPRERKVSLAAKRVRVQNPESFLPYRSPAPRYAQDAPHYQRSAPYQSRNPPRSQYREPARRRSGVRSEKPNIVVILTDDQDVLLGSLKSMPKVQRLLIRQGAYFNNSFVSTPMCCPSRSTFLTGLYVHNHNVYTNNANCSSRAWQQQYESRNFATYINRTYATGYFGKYLNEYDGNHTPPGWHRWVGLIKNSRFYNYSVVDERGVKTKHNDNYYADYLTDLVANDSRAFFHDSKRRNPTKPVMMVLSVPAPHGPEDAAPQYQHMFVNNTDHRTPEWNYAPNPDKQWLLQNVLPMMPQHKIFTDLLQRRRLQTLQSVDELVERVVEELDSLGELDNTYIIYTSDHGYHLGQFGLIKGKAMPFDFDVRVPLIMRGPGILPGTIISNIVSNIDIAPTLIDMAGETIPEHMDGESMLRLIKDAQDPNNMDNRGFVDTKRPWRDTVLLERGKLTEKALKQRMRTEERIIFNQTSTKIVDNFYIPQRRRKLVQECSKEENRLPCKPDQKWYCIEDNGRLRKHKCRNKSANASDGDMGFQRDQPQKPSSCQCNSLRKAGRKLNRVERRRQRRFLRKHVRQDFKPKFLRTRRSAAISLDSSRSLSGYGHLFDRRCRILANETVVCDHDIYQKASEWEKHKEQIDAMIGEYRKALEDLREIRRHLRDQRPVDVYDDYDFEDGDRDYPWDVDKDEDCDCDEFDISWDLSRRRPEGKLSRKENREHRRQIRKQRRRHKRHESCNMENMNCFTHDNHHWKTPPYWQYGPFCFCSNANNNTYWCLRTINQTHDFLYCEFITLFISFYDLKTDPFQLKNTALELNYGILQQLHEQLKKLQQCKSNKNCTLRSGQTNPLPYEPTTTWAGLIRLKKSQMNKYRDDYKVDVDDKEFYDLKGVAGDYDDEESYAEYKNSDYE